MKATIEFALPDDRSSFKLAVAAPQLHTILWNLAQWLRTELKHKDHSDEAYEALEVVRERLYTECEEQGIDLYDF